MASSRRCPTWKKSTPPVQAFFMFKRSNPDRTAGALEQLRFWRYQRFASPRRTNLKQAPMRRSHLFLVCLGTVGCGGYGSPASFPVTTAEYGKLVPRLPPCAQAVQLVLEDLRADRSVIGQRFMENTPGTRYPIQMQG